VTLRVMYFGAELVQLIVSQSDSELEVHEEKYFDCGSYNFGR